MINTRYLVRFLFRLVLATYFITHGLHLTKKLNESSAMAKNNLHSITGRNWVINESTVEFYAHFEVVMGVIIMFGWKLAKLSVIPYVINCLAFY